MITGLATSFVAMSCLGCTAPRQDDGQIRLDVGPVAPSQEVAGASLTEDVQPDYSATTGDQQFGLPVRVGTQFSPGNFARPQAAARFRALDLSTPQALRGQPGETLSAELAFGATAAETGFALDFEVAPRAQIERNRGGSDTTRTGGEVRIGQNLSERDLRGTNVKTPSWYFFVGAENEALVWNLADERSVSGVSLHDQVTVGDLQAGVAWSTWAGSQMSLGLVEREMSYSDANGDNDIKLREQFAAFSFTLRR